MKLWTIESDYGGTGEGRTIQALITYAENEAQAIEIFGKVFDTYSTLGATATEGVVKSEITEYLFNHKLFESVLNMEGKANVNLSAQLHFNYS